MDLASVYTCVAIAIVLYVFTQLHTYLRVRYLTSILEDLNTEVVNSIEEVGYKFVLLNTALSSIAVFLTWCFLMLDLFYHAFTVSIIFIFMEILMFALVDKNLSKFEDLLWKEVTNNLKKCGKS